MAHKHINWDAAREFYIKGDFNASGVPIDITLQNVADKFGVRLPTVWKMCKKHGWEDKRSAYRQQIFDEERKYEEQIREELRKAGLPTYANFMSQLGRMCYALIARYVEKLADKETPVRATFAEVMMAADRLERILNFLEGREKAETMQVDYTWKEMILNLVNLTDTDI
jgi:hypothetical protein